MEQVERLSRSAQDAFDRASDYCRDKPATAAAIAVAALSVSCAAWSLIPSSNKKKQYKRKPGTFELSGGNISSKEIKTEFEGYSKSYGTEAGAGITDRSNTSELVDKFYSLVTDIYEWGWGQSFHFSPLLPGKSVRESEAAHEARLAAILGLRPGKNVLDVGCGVGGPMRTIASTSGGVVTGITINDYQVSRAEMHNANVRRLLLLADQHDKPSLPPTRPGIQQSAEVLANCKFFQALHAALTRSSILQQFGSTIGLQSYLACFVSGLAPQLSNACACN